MVSLPMPWIQTMGVNIKNVSIEMDNENTLRIVAGDLRQDNPGYNMHSQPTKKKVMSNDTYE
ncbi:hypothetical protein [Methanolobus halotolerans]|nr:hypothetical protein [Methanolobus halotolerans]